MKTTARLTCLVALAAASVAPAQNLVQNPGFENTGSPDPIEAQLTDWNLASTGANDYLYARFSGVYNGFQYPWPSHSGEWAAAFGAYGTSSNTMSQDVPTVVGQEYTVSFYVGQWYGVVPGSFFTATFGDTTFDASTLGNFWAPASFNVTATSTTTRLSFSGGGLASDYGYYVLDDVSVQAVPEPASLAALGLGAMTFLRRRRR